MDQRGAQALAELPTGDEAGVEAPEIGGFNLTVANLSDP